jgi:tetratricopeptide (TPR) repeat protein
MPVQVPTQLNWCLMTFRRANHTCFALICLALVGCNKQSSESITEKPNSGIQDQGDSETSATASGNLPSVEAAQKQFDAGDINGALDTLSTVISNNPRSAEALFLRSKILTEKEMYSEAIDDLTKAIWENPDTLDYYLDRSSCYYFTQQFELSAKDSRYFIDAAIESGADYKPENKGVMFRAYYVQAEALSALGKHEDALISFDKAIEIELAENKFASAVWAYRGREHRIIGHEVESRRDIDHALQLSPDSTLVLLEKVRLECDPKLGDSKAAEAWLSKFLAIAPVDSNDYFLGILERGYWRLHQQQIAAGLEDLEQYLKYDRNATELNTVAWMLATHPDDAIRNGAKAKTYAEEANRLAEQKVPRFLGTLSAALAELGDFASAIETQERALADPDYEKEFGEEARKRLEEYRAAKPHREL